VLSLSPFSFSLFYPSFSLFHPPLLYLSLSPFSLSIFYPSSSLFHPSFIYYIPFSLLYVLSLPFSQYLFYLSVFKFTSLGHDGPPYVGLARTLCTQPYIQFINGYTGHHEHTWLHINVCKGIAEHSTTSKLACFVPVQYSVCLCHIVVCVTKSA